MKGYEPLPKSSLIFRVAALVFIISLSIYEISL